MIVVPSTLSGVLNDLPRYVKESEDVMGYIICDRVAIWTLSGLTQEVKCLLR